MKRLQNLLKAHALTLSLLIGAVATFAIAGFTAFADESEQLPEQILRLHIMAESNSDADQAFKYALRDFVLENFSREFAAADSLDTARELSVMLLDEIGQAATAFARESDVKADISVEVTEMFFTTRRYETSEGTFTLPAGTYTALRIIIGEGEGDNWWCVMFPALCVPAVSEKASRPTSTVTVPEVADEAPQIRFAIFEAFARWFA
jgi:stage II sporulation protein R